MKTRPRRRSSRRAAVTVEFAFVAPVFLAITLGVTETSRLFDVQNQLATAAREGARIAAMNRDGFLSAGQQTNEKIIQDVKNFLQSNGLPQNKITVTIKDHANPALDFDLDNPANDLKLFRLKVEIPFSAVNSAIVPGVNDITLSATVVFRNAEASIVQ